MRLIDADILKKEVKTMFCPDGYKIMMLERIDNAPELGYEDGVLLVEDATRRAIELEEAYNNGWSDGFSEGEDERPKGEWRPFNSYYQKCNKCERMVGFDYADPEHGNWFNYCPNCGADMRGGEQ